MRQFFEEACHMALGVGLLMAGVLELTVGSYLRDRARRIKNQAKRKENP